MNRFEIERLFTYPCDREIIYLEWEQCVQILCG